MRRKREKEKFTEEFRLISMNGGIVSAKVESEDEDLVYEIIEEAREALENNGMWCVSDLVDTTATYLGNELDVLDMRKIIGISY